MSHWFQKFSEFRELSNDDRQAFIVSKIIDYYLPKKAIELNQKFGVKLPDGENFDEFLGLVFLYCGSLAGGSSKWESEVLFEGIGSAGNPNRKRDRLYDYFKEFHELAYGFHRKKGEADVKKAQYISGLIAYGVQCFEQELDDLGRYLSEAKLSGEILDAVLVDASKQLGRQIYDDDINNRIRRWGAK